MSVHNQFTFAKHPKRAIKDPYQTLPWYSNLIYITVLTKLSCLKCLKNRLQRLLLWRGALRLVYPWLRPPWHWKTKVGNTHRLILKNSLGSTTSGRASLLINNPHWIETMLTSSWLRLLFTASTNLESLPLKLLGWNQLLSDRIPSYFIFSVFLK